MRELRFGIGSGGGAGARYWALKSAARRPELYLRGNRTGAFFGVSLHEHPDHWQWKIQRPGSAPEYKLWRRPRPFVPGLTRAVEVTAHATLAEHGPPVESKSAITWYQPQGGSRVHFNLFIEEAGANLSSWPGKNHGTQLVGRVSVADGSTAVIVASETEHSEQSWTLPAPDVVMLDAMRAAIRDGNTWMILMGIAEDGSAWPSRHLWPSVMAHSRSRSGTVALFDQGARWGAEPGAGVIRWPA